MLDIVRQLFADLDELDLAYCHWKSNIDLGAACNGEGDLDLLIAREDYACAVRVLLASGFKRMVSKMDRRFPGMEDFLGHDLQTGELVHVQAHVQLITGQALTKNLHFPFEALYLETRDRDKTLGVPIPNRSMEALIHCCRTFTKLGLSIQCRPALFRRHLHKASEEMSYLLPGGISELNISLVSRAMPEFQSGEFEAAASAILNRASLTEWRSMRRVLMKRLSSYQRRKPLRERLSWLSRRLFLLAARFTGAPPKRSFASGGLGMAIIGSDGAGKSSAISHLSSWLGKYVSVQNFHIGRPTPSIPTRVFGRATNLFQKLSNGSLRLPQPGDATAEVWPNRLAWIPALLYLFLAKDRRRTVEHATRLAGRGVIVVCDRFPLAGLGLMDSPRIMSMTNRNNRLYRRLAEMEEQEYAKIKLMDLTLLLLVEPATAAMRQPGDGEAYVLQRAEEVTSLAETKPQGITLIDANKPISAVHEELRRTVWATL